MVLTPLQMERPPTTQLLPSPLLQAQPPPILPQKTSPYPVVLSSNFAATSSTVYTATFTPSAAGATTIDVAANTFTNSGGVNNTAADQFNWTYDNVGPVISSVSLAATNATIAVTMNEASYNTNGGSGNLEATDFSLSISGGNATLASSTPSSISISGNVYTLGINLSSNMEYGTETLTVTPVANSIYDASGNVASTSQSNNTATLNVCRWL